jgi:hypothetical protein
MRSVVVAGGVVLVVLRLNPRHEQARRNLAALSQ